MKAVAYPISVIREISARAARRRLLLSTPAITQTEKDGRIREILEAKKAVELDFESQLLSLDVAALSKEEREDREHIIRRRQNAALEDFQYQLNSAQSILTFDNRDAEIADMDAKDAEAHAQYGHQEMTDSDINDRLKTEKEHDEFIRTRKYQKDRALEYPAVSEQLGALWKVIDALGVQIPESAADVRNAIAAVKAKYPKPEGD